MKSKLLLVFLFVCLVFVLSGVVVSGVECNQQMDWMQNASVYEINATKMVSYPDIPMYNGTQTINGGSWTNTTMGTNGAINFSVINSLDSNCSVSEYCIMIDYNFSSGSRIDVYGAQVPRFNVSNYSGIGFYYKGDGSTNYLSKISIRTNYTGSNLNYGSYPSQETACPLNYSGWENNWAYCYTDFGIIINNTQTSVPADLNSFSSVLGVVVSIFNYSAYNYGHIYLTNISIVDFNNGSSYYLNWKDYSTKKTDGRYQEGVYNLAYLYKFGNTGYQNNNTILNYTLAQMDWLARMQLYDGGWLTDSLQTHSTPASQGFPGVSFIKTLSILKDNPRLNDNLTMFKYFNSQGLSGNITYMTRWQFYNLTALRIANYQREFSNPISPANQYFIQGYAWWLYYNYTGNSLYLNNTINNLSYFNNTSQINNFGFNVELNSSSSIGFDIGYSTIGYTILNMFYQDSKLHVLANIITKNEEAIKNTMNNGYSVLINGSRGSISNNGMWDSYITKTAHELSLKYTEQLTFSSLYYSNGLGNSLQGYNLSGSSPYRSTFASVENYIYCSNQIIDLNIRFPQNYSTYSYDLLNETSWTRRNTSISGNIQVISQLEFPRMLFAWDNNNSWWIRGDYLTSNSSNWIYSDENGNFSLPITPKIRLEEGRTSITQFITNDNSNPINSTQTANGVWFSSSTTTSKHIASNLSQTIDATVIFDVYSCNIENIAYRSNSSTYNAVYTPGQFSCDSSLASPRVTLSLTGIEPSANSNELTINYKGSGSGGGTTGSIIDLSAANISTNQTSLKDLIKNDNPEWPVILGVIILILMILAVISKL